MPGQSRVLRMSAFSPAAWANRSELRRISAATRSRRFAVRRLTLNAAGVRFGAKAPEFMFVRRLDSTLTAGGSVADGTGGGWQQAVRTSERHR